jgi:short-subunit dehydrogenase
MFADAPIENFEWVINIDLMGVVYCTKAFLEMLTDEKEACIVNTSSLAGLVSMPNMLSYFTAKHGVKGFSDGLMMELKLEKATEHIQVTCVHPG